LQTEILPGTARDRSTRTAREESDDTLSAR
jgi:hypothetical protein